MWGTHHRVRTSTPYQRKERFRARSSPIGGMGYDERKWLMKTCTLVMVAGALLAATSIAAAAPVPRDGQMPQSRKKAPARPIMLGSVVDSPFTENFDSYAAGSGLAGQGGWQLWDPTSPNAFVDNSLSSSAPNSLRLDGGSDVIKLMNITSGKWRFTANTYFPSATTATGYLIALNTFPYINNSSWSIEMSFNPFTGMVQEYGSPASGTLAVRDQWIPVQVDIDLDTDLFNIWYNGVQIVTDRQWSTNILAGGAVRIQCWDLYASGAGTGALYYDDIVFGEIATGCYPNCDQSTVQPILNVDDFTCFINAYASSDPYANCDGSTTPPILNVDDFTCFINAYAQGCP
jgi:hypothetical protein